jgi:hypothetical protein
MFGFGKKKRSPPRIFEMVFFPDGEMIKDDWYDAMKNGLDRPEEGKVDMAFIIDGESCRLDATTRGGNAILSIWHGERIVTSSLFISAADEEANARLAQTYLDSVRRTALVRQLTDGQEAPFETIKSVRERPLLVTMLMPAPSPELTDALLERQRTWVSTLVDV